MVESGDNGRLYNLDTNYLVSGVGPYLEDGSVEDVLNAPNTSPRPFPLVSDKRLFRAALGVQNGGVGLQSQTGKARYPRLPGA